MLQKDDFRSNTQLFNATKRPEYLNQIYLKYIYYSFAIGVDNINHEQFNLNLKYEIQLIERKLKNNNYKFSRYKLKLISKGRGKPPRELYIPTIRDRIVLKNIQLYLKVIYGSKVEQETPQNIIKKLKDYVNTGNYSHFIKIDIKDFYPSINKEILLKKIRKNIRCNNFKTLLLDSLDPSSKEPIRGIPQGLSISNILAYIYLIDLDVKLKSINEIVYLRFVDDVFILLNQNKKDHVVETINKEFKRLKLSIHEIKENGSKSKIGKVTHGFDYLGYVYENGYFTVRQTTLNNLRNSIVECFTSYKYAKSDKKNLDFLIWRLNLKITGCIDDNQPKGWLYFFSQINNEKVLHELDFFVSKLWKKFSMPIAEFSKVKKFTRTYYEITFNFYNSNYIPNFDKYSLLQKIEVLENVFKIDTKGRSTLEIDHLFKSKTRKQIKKLLVDVRNFS